MKKLLKLISSQSRYCLSVFLLVFSFSVFAQTGSVTGIITDGDTGDPLIGATALIKGASNWWCHKFGWLIYY